MWQVILILHFYQYQDCGTANFFLLKSQYWARAWLPELVFLFTCPYVLSKCNVYLFKCPVNLSLCPVYLYKCHHVWNCKLFLLKSQYRSWARAWLPELVFLFTCPYVLSKCNVRLTCPYVLSTCISVIMSFFLNDLYISPYVLSTCL